MQQGCKGQAVPGRQQPLPSVRVGLQTHPLPLADKPSLEWSWPLWLHQQRGEINPKDGTSGL